jgi:hypothetical protein
LLKNCFLGDLGDLGGYSTENGFPEISFLGDLGDTSVVICR